MNFLLLGRHDDLQTLLLLSSHSCHLLIRKPRQCRVLHNIKHVGGFPSGSDGKASARNVGDPGSIPGSGRSPGEGNGNPLQYSCLENSMDGGALWATVHGVAKSRTRLIEFTSLHFTSLCIIGSSFIHLIRTDSNVFFFLNFANT